MIITPISVVAENNITIACSPKGLLVEGSKINMSEVLNIECLKEAIVVKIKALDIFYIDDDLNKTGNIVYLSIIAPKWEIIGKRKVILDGTKQPELDYAPSGIGKFKDGKPGKPGQSAGSFFAVGSEFINGANLEIHVNGGVGCPGQNGGNGKKKSTLISNIKYPSVTKHRTT